MLYLMKKTEHHCLNFVSYLDLVCIHLINFSLFCCVYSHLDFDNVIVHNNSDSLFDHFNFCCVVKVLFCFSLIYFSLSDTKNVVHHTLNSCFYNFPQFCGIIILDMPKHFALKILSDISFKYRFIWMKLNLFKLNRCYFLLIWSNLKTTNLFFRLKHILTRTRSKI